MFIFLIISLFLRKKQEKMFVEFSLLKWAENWKKVMILLEKEEEMLFSEIGVAVFFLKDRKIIKLSVGWL